MMALDLFFVSLLVLMLIMIVLVLLCWILKRSRNKILTELEITAGEPPRRLTIRTKPDHAHQLLDSLLDRVFLQVEGGPETGGQSAEEPEPETEEELGGECGSDPEILTDASLPRRTLNVLQSKLQQWMTIAAPPRHETKTAPPHNPAVEHDPTDNVHLQQLHASEYASTSSQGASCSASCDKEE